MKENEFDFHIFYILKLGISELQRGNLILCVENGMELLIKIDVAHMRLILFTTESLFLASRMAINCMQSPCVVHYEETRLIAKGQSQSIYTMSA